MRKFTSELDYVHFCNCLYSLSWVWSNMITVYPAVFAFMFVFVLSFLSSLGPIWLLFVFAFVSVLSFLSLLGPIWLTCAQLYLGVNSPIACVALTLCGNLHPSVHMDDVDLYWLQVQLYVHTSIGCKCFFSLFTPLPLHFNMTRPSLRWERSEEIFAHGRFKFWNWEQCLFLSKAWWEFKMRNNVYFHQQ